MNLNIKPSSNNKPPLSYSDYCRLNPEQAAQSDGKFIGMSKIKGGNSWKFRAFKNN